MNSRSRQTSKNLHVTSTSIITPENKTDQKKQSSHRKKLNDQCLNDPSVKNTRENRDPIGMGAVKIDKKDNDRNRLYYSSDEEQEDIKTIFEHNGTKSIKLFPKRNNDTHFNDRKLFKRNSEISAHAICPSPRTVQLQEENVSKVFKLLSKSVTSPNCSVNKSSSKLPLKTYSTPKIVKTRVTESFGLPDTPIVSPLPTKEYKLDVEVTDAKDVTVFDLQFFDIEEIMPVKQYEKGLNSSLCNVERKTELISPSKSTSPDHKVLIEKMKIQIRKLLSDSPPPSKDRVTSTPLRYKFNKQNNDISFVENNSLHSDNTVERTTVIFSPPSSNIIQKQRSTKKNTSMGSKEFRRKLRSSENLNAKTDEGTDESLSGNYNMSTTCISTRTRSRSEKSHSNNTSFSTDACDESINKSTINKSNENTNTPNKSLELKVVLNPLKQDIISSFTDLKMTKKSDDIKKTCRSIEQNKQNQKDVVCSILGDWEQSELEVTVPLIRKLLSTNNPVGLDLKNNTNDHLLDTSKEKVENKSKNVSLYEQIDSKDKPLNNDEKVFARSFPKKIKKGDYKEETNGDLSSNFLNKAVITKKEIITSFDIKNDVNLAVDYRPFNEVSGILNKPEILFFEMTDSLKLLKNKEDILLNSSTSDHFIEDIQGEDISYTDNLSFNKNPTQFSCHEHSQTDDNSFSILDTDFSGKIIETFEFTNGTKKQGELEDPKLNKIPNEYQLFGNVSSHEVIGKNERKDENIVKLQNDCNFDRKIVNSELMLTSSVEQNIDCFPKDSPELLLSSISEQNEQIITVVETDVEVNTYRKEDMNMCKNSEHSKKIVELKQTYSKEIDNAKIWLEHNSDAAPKSFQNFKVLSIDSKIRSEETIKPIVGHINIPLDSSDRITVPRILALEKSAISSIIKPTQEMSVKKTQKNSLPIDKTESCLKRSSRNLRTVNNSLESLDLNPAKEFEQNQQNVDQINEGENTVESNEECQWENMRNKRKVIDKQQSKTQSVNYFKESVGLENEDGIQTEAGETIMKNNSETDPKISVALPTNNILDTSQLLDININVPCTTTLKDIVKNSFSTLSSSSELKSSVFSDIERLLEVSPAEENEKSNLLLQNSQPIKRSRKLRSSKYIGNEEETLSNIDNEEYQLENIKNNRKVIDKEQSKIQMLNYSQQSLGFKKEDDIQPEAEEIIVENNSEGESNSLEIPAALPIINILDTSKSVDIEFNVSCETTVEDITKKSFNTICSSSELKNSVDPDIERLGERTSSKGNENSTLPLENSEPARRSRNLRSSKYICNEEETFSSNDNETYKNNEEYQLDSIKNKIKLNDKQQSKTQSLNYSKKSVGLEKEDDIQTETEETIVKNSSEAELSSLEISSALSTNIIVHSSQSVNSISSSSELKSSIVSDIERLLEDCPAKVKDNSTMLLENVRRSRNLRNSKYVGYEEETLFNMDNENLKKNKGSLNSQNRSVEAIEKSTLNVEANTGESQIKNAGDEMNNIIRDSSKIENSNPPDVFGENSVSDCGSKPHEETPKLLTDKQTITISGQEKNSPSELNVVNDEGDLVKNESPLVGETETSVEEDHTNKVPSIDKGIPENKLLGATPSTNIPVKRKRGRPLKRKKITRNIHLTEVKEITNAYKLQEAVDSASSKLLEGLKVTDTSEAEVPNKLDKRSSQQIHNIDLEQIEAELAAIEYEKNDTISRFSKFTRSKSRAALKDMNDEVIQVNADGLTLIRSKTSLGLVSQEPSIFTVESRNRQRATMDNADLERLNDKRRRSQSVAPSEMKVLSQRKSARDQKYQKEKPVNFKHGSLAWARIGGHPYWPCLITKEKISCEFKKQVSIQGTLKTAYHVRFFGDKGKRAWVLESKIIKYSNKDDVEQLLQKAKQENKPLTERLFYYIRRVYIPKWQKAVNEAEQLKGKLLPEKLQFFEELDKRRYQEKLARKAELEAQGVSKRKRCDSMSTICSEVSQITDFHSPSRKRLKRDSNIDANQSESKQTSEVEKKDRTSFRRNKQYDKVHFERDNKEIIPTPPNKNSDTGRENKTNGTASEPELVVIPPYVPILDNENILPSRTRSGLHSDVIPEVILPKKSPEKPKVFLDPDLFSIENQKALFRRNYLFKGVSREKVCHYCFQPDMVFKCSKGGCNGFYHLTCSMDVMSGQEYNKRKSRKKHTLNSILFEPGSTENEPNAPTTGENNEKSQSEDRVQIVTVTSHIHNTPPRKTFPENFREMTLAEQIDFKMKEIMRKFENDTHYPESSTDSSSDEKSLNKSISTIKNSPSIKLTFENAETLASGSGTKDRPNGKLPILKKTRSSLVRHVTADSVLYSCSEESPPGTSRQCLVRCVTTDCEPIVDKAKMNSKKLLSPEFDLERTPSESSGSTISQQSKDTVDPKNFKCGFCLSRLEPFCFVCRKAVSHRNSIIRQKCSLYQCGRYYHPECLKQWPQTQWSIIQTMKHRTSKEEFDTFVCPQHVCHTCASDDPRAATSRCSGDKIVKCLKCPSSYHSRNYCIPAGTEILSMSQVICPKHRDKNKSTINTTWCFLCNEGGNLICCETCPTSVHPECLPVNLTDDDKFICEDCESGRLPLYDEIVWVKLGAFRWWPALVLFPNEVPPVVMNARHSAGEFVVRFFGTYDHYWVSRGRSFLFQDGDAGQTTSSKKKVEETFNKAVEEAVVAHKAKKEFKKTREVEALNSLKPPPYIRIKVNKPVGNVRQMDLDLSNTTSCDCNPNMPNPCGPDSDCLNRLLMTECNPEVCPAGQSCQNQCFEKREYPPMMPYKTEGRGWGLKTLAPIKKGQFVIEYVGELIDMEEYQRRIVKMHEQKEENYYFLTIDKVRMIDAGPKGNMARFMNHCCLPNCETQKWTVSGDTRVGLFASVDIPAETELTFNYNLECVGKERKICRCGAPTCSGFIGVQKERQDAEVKKPKKVIKKKKPIEQAEQTVLPPCFICQRKGSVGLCNNKVCNKAYHLRCLSLTSWPEGNKFVCPWHNCNVCSKRTIRCCVKCINSYCPSHSDGNIRYDNLLGFVCSSHDPTKPHTDNPVRVRTRKSNIITEESAVTSTTSDDSDKEDDVPLSGKLKTDKEEISDYTPPSKRSKKPNKSTANVSDNEFEVNPTNSMSDENFVSSATCSEDSKRKPPAKKIDHTKKKIRLSNVDDNNKRRSTARSKSNCRPLDDR